MKLSKLVPIAVLAVGAVSAAQAAPNTAAIAAKLQATAATTTHPSLPPFDSKKEVKVYVKSLTPAERAELLDQYADLTDKQQKALKKWYKNLPASST